MNRSVEIFRAGQLTVGVAGVQLMEDSTPMTYGVTIKADASNANNVFVGRINVSATTGFVLDAGEEIFIPIRSLNKVHLIADAVDQKVHWITA